MNILLVGGSANFVNHLIQKFKKEGDRVCVLTGSRFKEDTYKNAFEIYRFPYDSESLRTIFESILPDVTIFLGAYDSNFQWNDEQRTMVRFSSGLMNLLMSFDASGNGRFVYLSSDEIYGGDYLQNIPEEEEADPVTVKGMAIAQGENLCTYFAKLAGKDVVILRLQQLYGMPEKRTDCNEMLTWFCLEALRGNELQANEKQKFALLAEQDAIEHIYMIAHCSHHNSRIYNLSSSVETNEMEIAGWIDSAMGGNGESIFSKNIPGSRRVLDNTRFVKEFNARIFGNTEKNIHKIISYMKEHKTIFLTDAERKPTFLERLKRRMGTFMNAMIPFAENILVFIPVFFINNHMTDIPYISRLDMYLLYVLLFAVIHGQQQSIVSAVLATVGFFFQQAGERSGLEVAVDYNTYVWAAQLFTVGLVVGYLHDRIRQLKDEAADEKEYLSGQLADIKMINDSNIRVKDALTTQIINQNDSIGKIYHVTSALNQLMPEEVLFRAAEMLGEFMNSRDVAIYTVSNDAYARLFSSTSQKARSGGNSILYRECGELSAALDDHKVYINREMNGQYPMMANGIYNNDELEVIVMIWSLPWDRMTLGQADYLVVFGYLIQNAVVHANRYLSSLRDERYVEGMELLSRDAFDTLAQSFLDAKGRGLTECTLLEVDTGGEAAAEVGRKLRSGMRNSDYIGVSGTKGLYVLLSNTGNDEAVIVMERFIQKGYQCRMKEEWGI